MPRFPWIVIVTVSLLPAGCAAGRARPVLATPAACLGLLTPLRLTEGWRIDADAGRASMPIVDAKDVTNRIIQGDECARAVNDARQ
jgi:hypothetical protein